MEHLHRLTHAGIYLGEALLFPRRSGSSLLFELILEGFVRESLQSTLGVVNHDDFSRLQLSLGDGE